MMRVARLFGALLRLYPVSFRAEFGSGMQRTFAARAASARSGGRQAFQRFLWREFIALIRSAAAERLSAIKGLMVPPVKRQHLESAMIELRHAMRRLMRTPGFGGIAILTLALAVAANVTIFTLVYQVILAPLPFPASDRLIVLDHAAPGLSRLSGMGVSSGLYREYAKLPELEGIALYRTDLEATVTEAGEPRRVIYMETTPSLGPLLGVRPVLGRWFEDKDTPLPVAGQPPPSGVAVISHRLWQSAFAGDPRAVGRTLLLNGVSHQVVGVMPSSFSFPNPRVQLFTVYPYHPATTRAGGFGRHGLARVRPGVTIERLRGVLNGVIADAPSRFPGDALARAMVADIKLTSIAEPLKDRLLGNVGSTLLILFGATVLVLVIACTNLLNLVLVRADAHQNEIGIRRALGASRKRLAAVFGSEALLVTALSAVLALGIASVAIRWLVLNTPFDLPRMTEVHMNGVAAAFGLLLCAAVGILLSLAPLLRDRNVSAAALSDSGRGTTAGLARMRWRKTLMAGQVSLSIFLLIASGLMLRSFGQISRVNPGFLSDERLVFELSLSPAQYTTPQAAAAFHQQFLARLHALPEVRGAAVATTLPMHGEGMQDVLEVEGRPVVEGRIYPMALIRRVSENYLDALGIRLTRGRMFSADDMRGIGSPVVVNQALAEAYFGRMDPVGQQIRPYGTRTGWFTIIGVITDTTTEALDERSPALQLILPLLSDVPARTPSLHQASYVVHNRTDAQNLINTIRRIRDQTDRGAAIENPELFSAVVSRSAARMRFTAMLMAIAAGVGLTLVGVGVYGVIRYGVALRAREIGVRLAFGAQPQAVSRMIVREGALVVVAGLTAGLGAAMLAARLLRSQLYGIAWYDPVSYLAGTCTLLAIGLLASWLPAHRASRANPLRLLR